MIPYRGGTPHVVVQASDPRGIEELVDLGAEATLRVAPHVGLDREGREWLGPFLR